MKADMDKLGIKPPGEEKQAHDVPAGFLRKNRTGTSKWWRDRLIGVCAAFTACLAILGTGMVFNGVLSGDSASADILYDAPEANPSYTVQYMAYATSYDVQPGDDGLKTVRDVDGSWCIPFDGGGGLSTVTKCVKMYADYETDWLTTDPAKSLTSLDGAYELTQIWFGQDAGSENEADFVVIDVPDDLSKITFTNNPDNPLVSEASDGHYNVNADGRYMICINDGDVMRLIYEPVDSWVSNAVDVFDYDVTDGGYYLEADYENRDEIRETSGQAEEEGLIYVDAMMNGIHLAYSGEGAKLGFGGGWIGTGLGDETVNNGLDTINVKNYGDSNGLAHGLASGVRQNNDIVWSDGVSAPRLFGGNSTGRADYTDGEYKFTFKKSGSTRILSAVESEYGTMAEDLDGGYGEFWILDGSPSSGADGHDPLWGSLDGKVYYYREGGDPEMLKTSDDGMDHDSFFGFRYTEDFTLYPGYTGPLGFFGYSDDDMWVFAARVDDDGKVMEDTTVLVADLGGIHGGIGYHADMWDVIDKVPYGERTQDWRLFVYWLERDGSSASCGMSFTLPVSAGTEARRATQTMMEAGEYTLDGSGIRTFLFDDGSYDRFPAMLDGDTKMTVTSGEEFTVPGGSIVEIGGLTEGRKFTITETGVYHSWHSAENGYVEGTAELTAGINKWTTFVSSKNKGMVTVSALTDGIPEDSFVIILTLDGMADTEVSAMDGSNRPLGSRFTDKDGKLELTMSANETLKLYDLPEGTFRLEPKAMAGWHVAEVLLDSGKADGSAVSGTLPAAVAYRYEENGRIPAEVKLEQSVNGTYGVSDIVLGNGALLSYRITVTNMNDTAMDVKVHDWLPEGLSAIASSVEKSGGTADGSVLSWDIRIEPYSKEVIEFTCEVSAKNGVQLANTVRASSDGAESDSNIVTAEVP